MSDAFDNSVSRMTRQIQRDQETLRRAVSHLPTWERLSIERATISSIIPHYSAFQSITETLQKNGTGALIEQMKCGGWLNNSALGIDRSLALLLADQHKLEAAASRSFGSTFHMIESLNRAHALATTRTLDSSLLSGLGRIQEEAAFALGLQARIEESVAGLNLPPGFENLLDRLTRLTDVGERIWTQYADHPRALIAAPDFLRSAPTRFVAAASRSTGLIITGDEGFAEEGDGLLRVEAGEIEERLRKINPALVVPYRGALKAFSRRGDDYIRQVTVSLRELFVHLLREVAPDQAIAAWDASLLPGAGKVTYKSRLTYVFRATVGSKAYATMAKNDIDHVLQNFFLLEGEGVHKLASDLEYEEVRLLVARCEFDLLVVLRAHELSVAASS